MWTDHDRCFFHIAIYYIGVLYRMMWAVRTALHSGGTPKGGSNNHSGSEESDDDADGDADVDGASMGDGSPSE